MRVSILKKLLFINVFLSCSINAMVKKTIARAVPVAMDKNHLKILLGKPTQGHYWNDFGGEFSHGMANQAAQKFLSQYTNFVYNVAIAEVPWQKVEANNRTDYFHIVPVPFIKGSELYKNATNKCIDDFAWVTPDDVKNGNFIHLIKGKQIIAKGLQDFFTTYWDQKMPAVKKLLQPTPSSAPSAPLGPQTADSVGANKLAPWLSAHNIGLGAYTNKNGLTKYAQPGYVYFYKKGAPYEEFSNYYRTSVIIDGKQWPTTEHYFQAMKSIDPNEQETIRKLPTPDAARTYWKNKAISQLNWHTGAKQIVMLKAVRAKVNQYPTIKKLLLDTGNAIIVENTFLANYDDPYWGNGLNDNGDNDLGRILMQVRAEQLGVIPVKDEYPYTGIIVQINGSSATGLIDSLSNLRDKLKDLNALL